MKTIAVIGAGGKSGRMFVKAALAAGYTVKAGVHRHNPFNPQEQLAVFTIDATKSEDIAALFHGCNAVVSLIGHTKGSPKRVQTEAMKIVIAEMKKQSISKVISLTGTGVRFPGDTISIADRMMNAPVALIDPNRIQDGIEHAKILKNSGLDWTIVRVLKLTNQTPLQFSLTSGGPGKLFVPRAEVANAILIILDSNDYSQKAPVISLQ